MAGGLGPVRGVGDGKLLLVFDGVLGDGLTVGNPGEGLAEGDALGRGVGDGGGVFRFAFMLKLGSELKFELKFAFILKLKFESNPMLVFRFALIFGGLVFMFRFAGSP